MDDFKRSSISGCHYDWSDEPALKKSDRTAKARVRLKRADKEISHDPDVHPQELAECGDAHCEWCKVPE
jgi:hypothetical protein